MALRRRKRVVSSDDDGTPRPAKTRTITVGDASPSLTQTAKIGGRQESVCSSLIMSSPASSTSSTSQTSSVASVAVPVRAITERQSALGGFRATDPLHGNLRSRAPSSLPETGRVPTLLANPGRGPRSIVPPETGPSLVANPVGRPRSITNPPGRGPSLVANPVGRPRSITNPPGRPNSITHLPETGPSPVANPVGRGPRKVIPPETGRSPVANRERVSRITTPEDAPKNGVGRPREVRWEPPNEVDSVVAIASAASARCMDAVVGHFGPTVRETIQQGRTRLIDVAQNISFANGRSQDYSTREVISQESVAGDAQPQNNIVRHDKTQADAAIDIIAEDDSAVEILPQDDAAVQVIPEDDAAVEGVPPGGAARQDLPQGDAKLDVPQDVAGQVLQDVAKQVTPGEAENLSPQDAANIAKSEEKRDENDANGEVETVEEKVNGEEVAVEGEKVNGDKTPLDGGQNVKLDVPRGTLKSYQVAGVQWLETLYAARLGCILADEMGLGKTLQVLTFLERQIKDGMTALVVTPTSLLSNWEDEIRKWTSLRAFRYHAASANVRDQLAQDYFALEQQPHVVLTTPNVLLNSNDRKNFIRRAGPFSMLVCDEGHFLKNSQSCKVVNLHKIDAPVRILMTGTPVQNDLSELVNLLWFILPDSFRGIRDLFRNRQTLPLELIQKLGAPFILRRLKGDVLGDLPLKHVVPVWCHMGEAQRKYHDELRVAGSSAPNDFKSLYSRIRRICNAPILNQQKFPKEAYLELATLLRAVRPDYASASDASIMREISQWSDYEVHQVAMEYGFEEPFRASAEEILAGCKIEALLKLLEPRRGKKTLLFSQYTQYLDVLEAVLSLKSYTYLRLDGSTPVETRHELVKEFNNPEGPGVFMLSTKAGGTGLNLVVADACILMDLDFNPQNNRQAEDRIHRLGQTRDVTIYYMLCKDTLEEKVLAINERKMDLDEKFGGQRGVVDSTKVMQWIMS